MKISELQVPHASQIVRLFNRDLPDGQWRRELLENARLAGATEILFGPWHDPTSGQELMRVSDNGSGMNPRKLEDRIRKLADPVMLDTFGIGGRIATAAVSPQGVAWASRESDAPAAMVMMRELRGTYGLVQYPQDDGTVAHVVEPEAGMLPSSYEQGTAVILFGVPWQQHNAHHLANWLSRRYWSFGDATVRVENWAGLGDGKSRIHPLGVLVERHAEIEGRVELGDGSSIRWYRLRRSKDREGRQGRQALAGLAVQYGLELLDRADAARFAQFILTRQAQHRVVLIVEPAADLQIEMTAQRSRLVRPGGQPLPWGDWARSWADQIPDPIAELLPVASVFDLEAIAAAFGEDWRHRIRSSQRTITGKGGDETGTEAGPELTSELEPLKKPEVEEPEHAEPSGTERRERTVLLRRAVATAPDGRTRARRGQRHDVPKIVAIQPEDWSYGANEDYAYEEALNELRYKTTGEAITRQTNYWLDKRPEILADSVTTTVRNAYAVEMVGKVLHVLDVFVGKPGWVDSLDEILSPRTLTFASLGFLAVDAMIEQGLSQIGERDHAAAA